MKIESYLSALLLILLFSCNFKDEIKTTHCFESVNLTGYNPNQLTSDTLCTDSLCKVYESTWKELFLESNSLTEEYFKQHIQLKRSGISDWEIGSSFTICFDVTVDWAVSHQCNSFIVKTSEDIPNYSSYNLPLNTYFSKETIQKVIQGEGIFTSITRLSGDENLKYNTQDDAINTLIRHAKVNALCRRNVSIDSSGHFYLYAGARYENENNRCIEATIDLINGETKVSDLECPVAYY